VSESDGPCLLFGVLAGLEAGAQLNKVVRVNADPFAEEPPSPDEVHLPQATWQPRGVIRLWETDTGEEIACAPTDDPLDPRPAINLKTGHLSTMTVLLSLVRRRPSVGRSGVVGIFIGAILAWAVTWVLSAYLFQVANQSN
jgi:hypothetical protein